MLTFGWRQSGALDRGGGVVVMRNAGMYRSLRVGARGGGARSAPRLGSMCSIGMYRKYGNLLHFLILSWPLFELWP